MEGTTPAGGPLVAPPASEPIPEHPGFIVRREYLDRFGISERVAAKRLGLSLRTLNELVCGKRDMTERTARRLERAGVRTVNEWMMLQERFNASRRRMEGGTNGSGGNHPAERC